MNPGQHFRRNANTVDRGGWPVSQHSRSSPHRASNAPGTPVPRGCDDYKPGTRRKLASFRELSFADSIEKLDKRAIERLRGLPEHTMPNFRQDGQPRSRNGGRDLPGKPRRREDVFLPGNDMGRHTNRAEAVARVERDYGVALARKHLRCLRVGVRLGTPT